MTKANLSVDNRLHSTSQKLVEYVSKTSWRRVKNSLTWGYVFKTSWRCLEDIFAICLEDVLKTSWKCLEDVFARSLEDVLKTSWKCLGKTSWRHMTKINIFALIKTSSEDIIYSSSARRLEDVLMMFSEDEDERRLQDVFETSSRRLHQDECFLVQYYYFLGLFS